MKNKKNIEISLTKFIISLIVVILIIGGFVFYIVKNENNTQNVEIANTENVVSEVANEIDENIIKEEKEEDDYFVLYKGMKIKLDTTVQYLDPENIELTEENKNIYNIKYYNYENGKYAGESEGELVESFEGVGTVDGVKRIAISEKYDAIPRTYTTIVELPKELEDMVDCSGLDINSIDLDGDGQNEYIVCYQIDNSQDEAGDGELEASSGIILFDSNYKKIADLVVLEDGFWGRGPKKEENKIFLSINDIEYIDIDKDGIMEIIINVPVFEGTEISIFKYNQGKLEGEKDFKASVKP